MSSTSLKFNPMSSSNKKSKQTSATVTAAAAAAAAGRKENTATKVVTEEELLQKDLITPEDVCRLASITKGYLCSPLDNIYDIEFTRFKIRDMDSGKVLFEIVKSSSGAGDEDKKTAKKKTTATAAAAATITDHDTESIVTVENYDRFANYGRFVRYNFTRQFLKLKTVGAR